MSKLMFFDLFAYKTSIFFKKNYIFFLFLSFYNKITLAKYQNMNNQMRI